jgi:signal transduction histidine kinase
MRLIGSFLHHALAPMATVVLGVSVVVIGWLVPAIEEARTTASRLALERANAVRAELMHSLSQAQSDVYATAAVLAGSAVNREQILAETLTRNTQLISIAVVDPDGLERVRLTAEDQREHTIGPRAHFLERYFASALAGTPVLGEVRYGPSGVPGISVVAPVSQGTSTVTGIVVAELSLASMVDGTSLRIGEGNVFVTDNRGIVIIHPQSDVVRERRPMLDVPGIARVVTVGEATTGIESNDGYLRSDGVEMFLAGVPARDGWGVFVEEPRSIAFAAVSKVVLLSLAFCILGALLFWTMYRRQNELERINRRFNMLLSENQQSGKLLIKKDLELHEANDVLERTNKDLQDTARILIRRDLELSDANERLEELDTVKSEFVSVAAHQLRTPLTGVRWSLKALAAGEYGSLVPTQQKIADDALVAIVGAIDLINDMLNVARVEGGRFNFAFVTQPLAPLVTQVFDHARSEAANHAITFMGDPLDQSIRAFCDGEKLVIAIQNVVDNAIKYTPEGGIVSVTHTIHEGRLSLAIKDTGIGIPKAEQHRLFTKFFRAPNAVLKQTSGTGLGLYLVKNIIERHKGSIAIESEEGKGTIITLTIPVVPTPEQSAKV